MCFFEQNLWSVSFVFATGSFAYVLLGLCYTLIDWTALWSGAPFIYPGMNAIICYCLSELLQLHYPFSVLPANNSLHDSHQRLLWANILAVALFQLFAWYLHQQNVFVKI